MYGLIYTIVLQRKEIEANREEIRKTGRSQRHAQKVMDAQLIQMKQTTQLHALNLLMDYFNRQIADPLSSPEKVALAREKRRETIAEIDKIIDRINDDELESMDWTGSKHDPSPDAPSCLNEIGTYAPIRSETEGVFAQKIATHHGR